MSTNYDYLFKILLIGDSDTKGDLLAHFSDSFIVDSYIATTGIDFQIRTLEIDGKIIKNQIWNTAGQERFRTVTSSYYRGAHGIIIVYDINDESSFINARKYFQEIERYACENINKLFIGNTCNDESKRVIDYNTAKEFAETYNTPYIEASSNESIKLEPVLLEMINKIYNRIITNDLNNDILNSTTKLSPKKRKSKSSFSLFPRQKSDNFIILNELLQNDLDDKLYQLLDNNTITTSELTRTYNGSNSLDLCFTYNSFKCLKVITRYIKEKYEHYKEEFNKYIPPRRVIVLGDGGAGKTTLIKLIKQYLSQGYVSRLLTNSFPNDNLATDGIAIDNITDKFIFWDFGGQEIFHCTHQFFLSDDVQYIIVIDIYKNFDNINQNSIKQTRYWLQIAKEYSIISSPSPIIICTHCDLLSKSIQYYIPLLNNLLSEYGLNKLKIYYISKKQNNSNTIEKLLKSIETNNSINSNRLTQNNLIFCYSLLKNILETKKQNGIKYIWWNEYIKVCNSHGLNDNKEIKIITKILVNFGIILSFKQKSCGGISLVILDPEWLINIFSSIISITYQQSSVKRGFFTTNILHNKWNQLNIPKDTWPSIIKLFEMFNLLCKLNSNEYYVPHMIHSQKENTNTILSYDETVSYILKSLPNFHPNINYERIYEYDSNLPKGFIDRIIVRLLHFPFNIYLNDNNYKCDFTIDKNTTEDNFILISDYYWILICFNNTNQNNIIINQNNIVRIKLFVINEEFDKSIDGTFFHHFLFQSPEEILKNSFITSMCKHIQSNIYYNYKYYGTENELITKILSQKQLFCDVYIKYSNICPDIFIRGIKLINTDNSIIIKRLASGTFGIAWLGQINDNNDNNTIVVYKELKNPSLSLYHQKEFIRETLVMSKISSKYLVELKGIGTISASIKSSVNKIKDDNIKIGELGLLMVLEYAKYGDLTNVIDIISQSSIKLRIKLAYDIARGLYDIHYKSGIKFIHRDIRSQNIFIFSLDEDKINNKDYIHAKIGDFGTLVVGNPVYTEEIGNWQYMAPEAFKCDFQIGYNQSIDVYSFGMILWEIFACQVPYKEYILNAGEIKDKIIEGFRPTIPNNMNNSLKELLEQCWHQNPIKRPLLCDIISTLVKEL